MSETTGFLYPFIEGEKGDVDALLRDLAESARAKTRASAELGTATLERCRSEIDAAGTAMLERIERGGRVFVFGNGGSSTDAASLANLFVDPPWGVPLAARFLVGDSAVLTAIGNDVGFDLVFSRQLVAYAGELDVAIGLSTSGNSPNLLMAFEVADARNILTIGIAGYSGGEMARSPHVRHCLVVEAGSVHRIQEAQAALGFALWQRV
jgi:D-sedoheptulose 7-phosphate isomerase